MWSLTILRSNIKYVLIYIKELIRMVELFILFFNTNYLSGAAESSVMQLG